MIEQDIVDSADTFRFRIDFKAKAPEFVMEEWKVDPLTCTEADLQWSV